MNFSLFEIEEGSSLGVLTRLTQKIVGLYYNVGPIFSLNLTLPQMRRALQSFDHPELELYLSSRSWVLSSHGFFHKMRICNKL